MIHEIVDLPPLQRRGWQEPNQIKSVAVVLDRQNGQMLYGHKPYEHDEFVQGTIDPGEDPEQAAWRELHEETSLTSKMVRLVPDGCTVVVYYRNAYGWAKCFCFLFELRDGVPQSAADLAQAQDQEFTALCWASWPSLQKFGSFTPCKAEAYQQMIGNFEPIIDARYDEYLLQQQQIAAAHRARQHERLRA